MTQSSFTPDPQGPSDAGRSPQPAGASHPASSPGSPGSPNSPRAPRTRIRAEILIILGLSLGQSGIYAALNLLRRYLAPVPLSEQTASLNVSQSAQATLDLIYQILAITFGLVPVALALFLLTPSFRASLRKLGIDASRPLRDLGSGVVLAAVIGIPGLGLYAVGRLLGLSTEVVASALNTHWWTIPILILAALKNAVLEEVIVVGYLVTRLEQLRWHTGVIIATSALLRGSYHLYQGPAMALGNVVMGIVFSLWFLRTRRTGPLIIAHTILDVAAFVGYALLPDSWLNF